MTKYLIVGAGPAGMSAALEATKLGITPLVVDNRPEPGGNIYAFLSSNQRKRPERLNYFGAAYRAGLPLLDAFLKEAHSGKIDYRPFTRLWHLEPNGTYSFTGPSGTKTGKAEQICIATGAQERPMPIPGWTLPGVMGVGAAQLLMKAGGDLPAGPVWIVGSGPLPLLLAEQIRLTGNKIAGFVEPEGATKTLYPSKEALGALAAPKIALKGLYYLARRKLSGIPVYKNARQIEILGDNTASGLRFNDGSQDREVEAGLVLLHDGIVPNVNTASAAGCEMIYDRSQNTFHAVSSDNFQIAGDAAQILGAEAAELTGRIATLRAFGGPIPAKLTAQCSRHRNFRRFLDSQFPAAKLATNAPDDAIICRCEAVTAGQIRSAARALGPDANRIKTTLRAGMGPCQGRFCGHSVLDLVHGELRQPYSEVAPPKVRSPILPVTFGDIADQETETTGR